LEPEVIFILIFVQNPKTRGSFDSEIFQKPQTRGSFDSEIFQKPQTRGYYKIKEPPIIGAHMC
jgi:hypothetical protein